MCGSRRISVNARELVDDPAPNVGLVNDITKTQTINTVVFGALTGMKTSYVHKILVT